MIETQKDIKGQLLIIEGLLQDGTLKISKKKVAVINSIIFLLHENRTKKWKYSPEIKRSPLERAPFWFTCSTIFTALAVKRDFSTGL